MIRLFNIFTIEYIEHIFIGTTVIKNEFIVVKNCIFNSENCQFFN